MVCCSFDVEIREIFQGKRCKICRRDFHHQCAEHLPADCPGIDARNGSLVRRASSNTTISSASPGQVYTDGDFSSVCHTPPKRTKFGKLFNTHGKHGGNNPRSASMSTAVSSTSSMVSTSSKAVLTNSSKPNHDSSNSSGVISDTPSGLSGAGRKHYRNQDQNSISTNRPTTPSQNNVKSDRRKDIKLTNCQEKDGVWTATGQFGRESRHSKRTDITFDRKRFRFIQKDEQGNKQVSEIAISDIEGK